MSAFTPAGSGGLPPTPITIAGSTAGVSATVNLILASTEYSFTFPTGTRQFLIKLRGRSKLQYSYTLGGSGTSFTTLERFCFYSEIGLLLTAPITLYFQCTDPGQVAEITYWT